MGIAFHSPDGRFSVGQAWFAVIAFGLIIALPYLFLTELQSGDETRVAGIAAEMFFQNDFLVPRLGGKPFLEYPPLAYQLMAGSFRLFGINDAAARLPSVLFAIGGMILTFLFGLRPEKNLLSPLARSWLYCRGRRFCNGRWPDADP